MSDSVATVTLTGDAVLGLRPTPHMLTTLGPAPALAVKLGCHVRLPAAKAPRLGDFVAGVKAFAATLPPKVDYTGKAAGALARMYLNDQYGCCVISGKAHSVGVWSGNDAEGAAVQATDQEVLAAYNRLKAGRGDSGCIISDVLDAFTKGIQFGGKARTIDGYCSVDHANQDLVKVALYLFGSLTIGINLPEAWMNSAVWDATNSRIVGGHDVSVVGYDADGLLISSWGRIYHMTWRAFTARNWVSECYGMLSNEWYGADGKAAAVGLDLAALKEKLRLLTGGDVPPVDPPVVPPVVPPVPPAPTTKQVVVVPAFSQHVGAFGGTVNFPGGTFEVKTVPVVVAAGPLTDLRLLREAAQVVTALTAVVAAFPHAAADAWALVVDVGLIVKTRDPIGALKLLADVKVAYADFQADYGAAGAAAVDAFLAAVKRLVADAQG